MIQTIFGSPVVILKPNVVEELFSEEIYDEMIELLMSPDNKFVNHPYTRGGKICTTDISASMNSKINRLTPLLNFLKNTGLQYANLYSDKTVKDLKFDNMWINLSFRGCEIKNHYDRYENTKDKSLIMLFYPKAPVGGSNLVFIHNSKYGDWIGDYSEKDIVKIGIEEGDVIIIDNSVLHAVDKHEVTEPRMCVASEFKLETV